MCGGAVEPRDGERERGAPPMDANAPKTHAQAGVLMNASVVHLLASLKADAKRTDPSAQHPAFEKALAYASRFSGAISAPEQAAFVGMVGELEDALAQAQLVLRTEDGSDAREGLLPYESAALANLNPASPDAARQLVPTLERFTDESILDLLRAIKRVSMRLSGFGGEGGGGGGGGGGGAAEEEEEEEVEQEVAPGRGAEGGGGGGGGGGGSAGGAGMAEE